MRVVFDFGGVLFRWHPPSFLARVWPQRCPDEAAGAVAAREFFTQYAGDWGAFDQGLIGPEEVIHRIAARTGWPEADVRAVVDAVPSELQAVAGTVALIEAAQAAGHRTHYLSNMPGIYADHLERQYPLDRWFESGIFSSRVKHSKPGAEIFSLMEAQLAVPPEDIVFLDDHPDNIEAAAARGWQAILFTTPEAASATLRERGLIR
ncbi:HAD family phosphatase [Pelomonas sp. APW6]|uniref:HAD family phosphatase n=1 Tax=Roseateles subflavus TaxID=3053353 RepID=A0ABT7LKJ3_9BURK|nr:HAD family phosphatase [Pelomonas sp. APW6]MDL5032695.1 HAD family phosphatase [Pelomonas sp. APW6]